MEEPKKKKSKARTRMGRAHHALTAPNLSACPNCQEPRESHRVCPSCGHYRGRQIFEVVAEDDV